MKANFRFRRQLSLVIAGAGLLGSCAVPRVIPPVAAPPVAIRPTPPPPGPPADWRDLPVTPGVWNWQREAGRSVARFAAPGTAPVITLTCDRAAGQVLLARAGIGEGHVPMAISTTNGTRPLTSEPAVSGPGWVTTAIRTTDPILDAMAFSRGRFALDVAGLPMLALPSWPEVSRVIEDCR